MILIGVSVVGCAVGSLVSVLLSLSLMFSLLSWWCSLLCSFWLYGLVSMLLFLLMMVMCLLGNVVLILFVSFSFDGLVLISSMWFVCMRLLWVVW